MDSRKKRAMIDWVNALVEGVQIKSLFDVQDGYHLIELMKLSDDTQIYDHIETVADRYHLIKLYLEGSYSTVFESSSLINFEAIVKSVVQDAELEWEIAKMLLALLGAFVQDKNKEMFMDAALQLSEATQIEIMHFLEPIIARDLTAQLPADFADILKKNISDTTAHPDVANFFKIVAHGKAGRMTSTPTVEQSFTFPPNRSFTRSLCNGSIKESPVAPHHHPHVANLSTPLDISSPLRMLTIASPGSVTPLGALMQSPQLQQKVMLRQKERELKKLELALQNERHLRTDLELDLKDKSNYLEEKERRIKELEKEIKEQRKLKDQIDELESLRAEKLQLENNVSRAQMRITEFQDLKANCQYLEKENKNLVEELNKMKCDVQTLGSLKKSHEEYRTQCHKQGLRILELESLLNHRSSEIEQKQVEITQLEEARKNALHQRDILRQEKNELEEVLAGGGFAASNGESMAVVSEKRVSELESELAQLQTTWYKPDDYHSLQKQLSDITQAKESYEEKFKGIHKQLLEKEGELEQLQNSYTLQEGKIQEQELANQNLCNKLETIQKEMECLQDSEAKLKASEESLKTSKQELETSVQNLEKELSRSQAELQLMFMEAESQKVAVESRRQTMAASIDNVKAEKVKLEQKLSSECKLLQEKLEEAKNKLRTQKAESATLEESLKGKLQSSQNALKQAEILLENERWAKENVNKALKEEMQELKDEITDTEKKLQEEVRVLTEMKVELENRITVDKSNYEQKIEQLTQEFDEFKSTSKSKQETMREEINDLGCDKNSLQSEIDRLKVDSESLVQSWENKYSKLENKMKEQESNLRKEIIDLTSTNQCHLEKEQKLEEEIIDLKKTLEGKNDAISELEDSLKSFDGNVAELKQQLDSEMKSNCNLKETISQLECDITKEKTKHAEILESLNSANENLIIELKEKLHCTKEKLQSTEETLQSSVQKSKETQKDCNEKICDLEAKLTDVTQSKVTLEKQNCQIVQENEKNLKIIGELSEEISNIKKTNSAEIERMSAELQKSESESCRLAEERDRIEEKFQLALQKGSGLDERVSQLVEEKNNAVTAQERMKENIDELTGQLGMMKKVVEGKQNDNNQLLEEIKMLSQESEKQKTENEQLQTQLEDVNKVHTDLERQLTEMKSQNTQLQSEITSYDEKCKVLENELVQKVKSFSDNVDSLKLQNNEANKKEQEYKEQIVKNQEEIKTLSSNLVLLNEEINSLNLTLSNSEKEVDQLKIESEKLREEKNELLSTVDKLRNEGSASENTIVSKNEEVISLQRLLDTERQKLQEAESNHATALAAVAQRHQCELEELKSNQEEILMQEKEKNQAELSELEKQRHEEIEQLTKLHESQTSGMKSLIESEKDELAKSQQSEINEIRAQFEKEKNLLIQQHEDDMREKSRKISAVEQQLKSACEKHERFEGKISELSKSLEAEVDSKNKLKQTYENQISCLQNQLTNENGRSNELQKQIQTKMEDGEKYWRLQMEDLGNEYARATEEQKREYQHMMEQQQARFDSRIESIMQEKEMILLNQKTAFQERVSHLEMRLQQKNSELENSAKQLSYEKESAIKMLKEEHELKFKRIQEMLNAETENQKQISEELKQHKNRANELEIALNTKRLSFDSKLEEEKEHWEKEMEKLKKEHSKKMSELEQEKKQLLEDERKKKEESEEITYQQRKRLENNATEISSYKQQLAAVEEEKFKLVCDYEKKLEQKTKQFDSDYQDQMKKREKLEAEKRIYMQKLEAERQVYVQKCEMKVAEMKEQQDKLQQELKEEINQSQKQFEEVNESYKQLKQQFKEVEAQRKKLQEINDNYKVHYNNKKEILELVRQEADMNKQVADKFQAKSKKLDSELQAVKTKLKEVQQDALNKEKNETEIMTLRKQMTEETNKNKSLFNQIKSMEAQLKHADQQIREYRKQLDTASEVFLGDDTEFLKMKKESDRAALERNFRDSVELKTYDLRTKSDPNDSIMSTLTVKSDEMSPEGLVVPNRRHSTHSNRHSMTLRNRRVSSSDSNLNKSIISTDSTRSTSSVPRGAGNLFSCEDEPSCDFEWNRLSELQRRNTLCLPHMKSAYPVEMQQCKPKTISDDALRESVVKKLTASGKKRKKEILSDDSEDLNGSFTSKQARHGQGHGHGAVSYQKPGPPTPGNNPRTSTRNNSQGTPKGKQGTPKGKLKLPKTPGSIMKSSKKSTPRRTPFRKTPKISVSDENGDSVKKPNKRESIAFSIGFTPTDKKLSRQTGFVQSGSKSSAKVSHLIKMFETKGSASRPSTCMSTPKKSLGKTPGRKAIEMVATPIKALGKMLRGSIHTPRKSRRVLPMLDLDVK